MEVNSTSEIDTSYFKIDYDKQNYKKSNIYKKWLKKQRSNINNGIEIKCDLDNIVFFKSNNDESIICPICKSKYYKCPSCGKVNDMDLEDKCCFRSYFKSIIKNKKILEYAADDFGKDKKWTFINYILAFFIPSYFGMIICFSFYYFLYLGLKNKDNDGYDEVVDRSSPILLYIILTNGLLISVLYMIFFYYIYILTILISFPFKLYPIKLIIAIISNPPI